MAQGSAVTAAAVAPPTRVRYSVLSFAVVTTMIMYMDRVAISSAVPAIQKEFGFSIVTMGWILSSFQWAYAIFQVPGGWLGDRFGPRRALAAIIAWWSVFSSATALAWGAASMSVVRFLFGMGEAGAFSITTRAMSRWVLPTERGFAQGATHAGSRLGGALTPALAAFLIARYGWRTPFWLFGSVGAVWAAAWYCYYRDTPSEHKSTNAAEQELIRSSLGTVRSAAGSAVPWKKILSSRQMWLLAAMYSCYAYIIGVYLVWFPKYLNAERGFGLEKMGLYASLPLLAGTIGDLLGGWLTDQWAKRASLRMARVGMAVVGFLGGAAGILAACFAPDPEISVFYSCLALFSLELTVGSSWAIPLDIAGDYAGSVAGVMNTGGNLGGAIGLALTAYLVELYGWEMPFVVMSALALTAAVLFVNINAGKRIV